ncbi:MAG: hydroxyacid dehydrogenase [Candidatus Levybacteria bacterium]|nr:hydroxyacid dehydrogenase [Candidatus Levybacteria bacterium]
MSKIVFFEVQDWEKEILQKEFPEAVLSDQKLSIDNASSFSDAEIVSSFIYSSLTKEVIDTLSRLKLIVTRSTGFDHIDIAYCKSKNIAVANVPEYGSNTVAEHTFALILTLTRKMYKSVNQAKNLNFDHREIRGIDVCEKTIGIVGLGKIGINVLRIAKGFGMKMIVCTRSQKEDLAKQYGFTYVTLDTLLQTADIISLHVPLNNETKHIINKDNILTCKKGSYLINTARGGIIDTEAIILGLNKGILDGVGIDVLEEEKELNEEIAILTTEYGQDVDLKTLIYNHILINHPKVIITPHNAFNSEEALMRIEQTTIENIHSFLEGKLHNTVNG